MRREKDKIDEIENDGMMRYDEDGGQRDKDKRISEWKTWTRGSLLQWSYINIRDITIKQRQFITIYLHINSYYLAAKTYELKYL